jgi:protocatechuate 3,4-dioxygenase beta subunit
MYYPGVTEFAQAVPVTLAAGQEMRGADLQVRKVAVYRIRGRVVDEAGKPATNAAVMAMQGEGSVAVRSMGMVRNAEGTFEIPGVTPGAYTLMVNRMSREDRRARAYAQVNVGNRDVEGVVLQMGGSFPLSGRLRVPDDEPMPENVRVGLEPLRNLPAENSESVKAEDGAFTFESVSPGDYRFTASGLPTGMYVRAVMVHGQDITAGATVSAAAQDVEIVLGTKAPEVSGTVLDGDKQPALSAYVVLVPESSQRTRYWLFRTATTDSSGGFSIRGIVPGRYSLYTFPADSEEGSWYDPEVLKNLESKAAPLELEAGDASTMLQLTLGR